MEQLIENSKPPYIVLMLSGLAQILLWGGSYFLLSVLSGPIMQETGWSYQQVYGCLSLALLISGLLLPGIGKMIQQSEKNVILHYTGIVMGIGLIMIGLAKSYLLFVLGWVVIGVGMGMGLYDALFASLGKLYGTKAKKVIVWVTLIASLAPSVSWPFTSFLLQQSGWRHTCFALAGILMIVIYPVHKYIFQPTIKTATVAPSANVAFRSKIFYLLLANFTIGAIITTGVVVHLIDILSAKKIGMSTILFIVAFLGPSQSAARTLELMMANRSAVEMAFISTFAMLLGIGLLFFHPSLATIGIIIFGVGNGMRSVLRGTLPLAIYGPEHYPLVIGRLARMPLIAQAAAPFIGGFMIQQFGTTIYLCSLCALLLINLVLIWNIKSYELQLQKSQLR
ncbi:MFS transporter [Chitinophaga sp.]|uniref:MFS transporter n=1 Tax=Chitinophaga sp. TaxID=1869181 RepID=UPI0031DA599A